jgi:hypothetical protein
MASETLHVAFGARSPTRVSGNILANGDNHIDAYSFHYVVEATKSTEISYWI